MVYRKLGSFTDTIVFITLRQTHEISSLIHQYFTSSKTNVMGVACLKMLRFIRKIVMILTISI